MNTDFNRSCVVPVKIPGKVSLDFQVYGVSASSLPVADKIEFVLSALSRRGLPDSWLETVQIGAARDDVVLARKRLKK